MLCSATLVKRCPLSAGECVGKLSLDTVTNKDKKRQSVQTVSFFYYPNELYKTCLILYNSFYSDKATLFGGKIRMNYRQGHLTYKIPILYNSFLLSCELNFRRTDLSASIILALAFHFVNL